MNLRWPIAVLISAAFFLHSPQGKAQQNLIDSLIQIQQANRDSVWVYQALKASYKVVYNDPVRSEEFLRTIYRTAVKQGLNSWKSQVRLNQGIAKDVMNEPDSAIRFYNLGLAIAKERKDTAMIAAAYNNIGLIHWNSERLDSALVFYRLSEELFEDIENQRGLLSTMNNMGLIYQSLERREEAVAYFRKVVQTAEEMGNFYFEAVGHQNIASTYSHMFNADSAYFHLLQAIPIQEETDDLRGLAKSYHTMGLTLSVMGLDSLDRAEMYFKRAIELNVQHENLHALASNYYTLSDVYRQKGDWANRLSVLKKAFDLREAYNDDDLYHKSTGAYYLELVRGWNEDIAIALRKAFMGKDSLYRAKLEGRVLDLQELYEAEKREQELLIKNFQLAEQEDKAVRREQLIWGLVIALVILTLFGFLFVSYRAKLSKLKSQQRLAKERSRISRDLHDNIGAQLTSISTRMDLLNGTGNEASALAQIKSEAADTVSMLRDTIWAIHREEFSVPQFMTRIGQYANRILPNSTELQLTYDPNLENYHLNSSQALNLFRIAQEGIQNSMKHSGANKISIAFKLSSNGYQFVITDNGAGCQMPLEIHEEGYGLQNIRERTSEINGSVEFYSDENQGFTVQVSY